LVKTHKEWFLDLEVTVTIATIIVTIKIQMKDETKIIAMRNHSMVIFFLNIL